MEEASGLDRFALHSATTGAARPTIHSATEWFTSVPRRIVGRCIRAGARGLLLHGLASVCLARASDLKCSFCTERRASRMRVVVDREHHSFVDRHAVAEDRGTPRCRGLVVVAAVAVVVSPSGHAAFQSALLDRGPPRVPDSAGWLGGAESDRPVSLGDAGLRSAELHRDRDGCAVLRADDNPA